MGESPCQRDDKRFTGEARHLYLTVYDHEDKLSFRYVVCPSCFDEILDEWASRAYHRARDGAWELRGEDPDLNHLWVPVEDGGYGRRGPYQGRQRGRY